MKTHQKLLTVYLVILISILPSCIETIHKSASTQPNISVSKAIDSMKEAIKDTIQNPGYAPEKAVTDVNISEAGITLINSDNTKRYYAFADIIDPNVEVYNDAFYHNIIFIRFYQATGNSIVFSNSKSAKMFADALYYLKHVDIKKELEREREDCLRQIRQTPIDLILVGTTSDELSIPCSSVPGEHLESVLNEILVDWKNKGLGGRLQNSSSSQLNDLVTKMEKGILKLDLKTKKLKDLADEDARQVTAPGQAAPAKKAQWALSLSHLLDQRKTILIVILGSVKQVAAQRASGG